LPPATPKRSFPQEYVFPLPSIEQNFYFVQFGTDFKMPLSIGFFIENRRTADQRHVRCASVRTINRCAAVFTLEPPTTLTDQSYRIFSGILKSNTS